MVIFVDFLNVIFIEEHSEMQKFNYCRNKIIEKTNATKLLRFC